MKNIISKYINIQKPHKVLTESDSSSDIKVYMNTWKNYNEYGADLEMYGIKDGWMSIDDALEFCKKYSEDEPFINDVDNCPIEVSEYDNPVDTLNKLSKLSKLSSDELEVVSAFIEDDNYKDIDDIIEKVQSGDYIFFPGVSDDKELGEAYVNMVGIEGVSNPQNYLDTEEIKRSIDADSTEDFTDEELDQMAEDEIEANAGNMTYYEQYFDYSKLGRELSMEGYSYTDAGAIYTM